MPRPFILGMRIHGYRIACPGLIVSADAELTARADVKTIVENIDLSMFILLK